MDGSMEAAILKHSNAWPHFSQKSDPATVQNEIYKLSIGHFARTVAEIRVSLRG